ncbi:amidohydrolase family protein [Cupriavidus necator]|uniref:amidohydrolase family protein n=1 Tax=Cupriavidus necator TaxID=106590 RepID=UPI0009B87558|nr:amidohydrolase family protein [Cupriavidus necator]
MDMPRLTASSGGHAAPAAAASMRVDTVFERLLHKLPLALAALLAGACATHAVEVSVPPEKVVLYEGATLISGDGRAAIVNSAFLVEGEKITRIGRKGDMFPPKGAARVDLSGKTVIPTLVNAHSHPGYQNGLSNSQRNYSYENYLADLNRSLYYGVSVVMSLGIDKDDVGLKIRAGQRAGKVGGARLLTAGRGIGAPNAGPGGTAYTGIAYEATTEADVRRDVQDIAASRADQVKVWVDDRGGRAKALSQELYTAAIDEGHKQGIKVAAHVFYHVDAVALVGAGVDSLAHLVRDKEMSSELIADIVRKGTYIMPNLAGAELFFKPPPDDPNLEALMRATLTPPMFARAQNPAPYYQDPAATQRAKENFQMQMRSLVKLNAAGARIILGPDTGILDNFFGATEHRELELMVNAGMTPAQVIVAATSRTAEYLGLADTGSLVPGKNADFIVLNANSLDDIKNTRLISKVFVKGTEVDRPALAAAILRAGAH